MDDARISVALCLVGPAAASASLKLCLAALSEAGVIAPTVFSGVGTIATLRNEALAATRTSIIAFVDDDIAVDRSWLTALTRVWEAADDDVACIGGPIGLRFSGGRPRWLSDQLAGQLGVDERRLSAGDVDPMSTTFFAGNVSFRCEALAGIGAFWPARGAERLRDRYNEEHHAQHELARCGWRARYEPELAANRIIDCDSLRRSDLLQMQALASARRVLINGNPQRSPLLPALKGAAGSLAAAAMLKPALAVERATRAAGHIGALAPVRLAAKTLQPTASQTPFQRSVPMPTARARPSRSANAGPTIWCYHRVSDQASSADLAVTPEQFSRQLEQFCAAGPALTLEEIAGGDAPANGFAVSFDDGYADNLEVALPLLEAASVPATFFITTDHVRDGKPFWWDELARLLDFAGLNEADRGPLRLGCDGAARAWNPSQPGQMNEVRRHLVGWLQPQLPELIEQTIAELRAWCGADAPTPNEADRPMTIDELRLLAASPLATIGAHTRSHPSLRAVSPDRRAAEWAGARDDLTAWLGSAPTAVAYPFGVWGVDVDLEVAQAARAAGYKLGVVHGRGPEQADPMLLARKSPPGDQWN